MIVVILSLFLGFFIGYSTGRKAGRTEGEELGILYAPLMIKKASLEKGQCQICKSTINCYNSTSMLE